MTFVCTKCGYHGPSATPHLAPRGSGRLCNYEPFAVRSCEVCGRNALMSVERGYNKGGYKCHECGAEWNSDGDRLRDSSERRSE